jgi:hypothetical protein
MLALPSPCGELGASLALMVSVVEMLVFSNVAMLTKR